VDKKKEECWASAQKKKYPYEAKAINWYLFIPRAKARGNIKPEPLLKHRQFLE
jgi:hypothetical protein